MPTAYAEQTIKLIWDQSRGTFLDAAGITLPTGYARKLIDLWAQDSLEIQIYCYESYTTAAVNTPMEFGDAATTKLYIRRENEDDDDTELATGTVTKPTDNYNLLTYVVHKDDLPLEYAGCDCLVRAVTLDDGTPTAQRTCAMRVPVSGPSGTEAATLETEDIAVSTVAIATNTALTAYPGLVVYFVDTSAGNVALTLPSAAAYAQQEIVVIQTSALYTVTLTGTVGATVNPTLTNKAGVHLYSNGTVWAALNPTVIIR